jgi:catechol 2,3-dioxygenase-like lactoylglutathione lyase family enzyme
MMTRQANEPSRDRRSTTPPEFTGVTGAPAVGFDDRRRVMSTGSPMNPRAPSGLIPESPPTKEGPMLSNAHVATRLPAQDLDRARRFYAEKLGLEPADERPGGLLYRLAGGQFALYTSTGSSPGTFTQMGFEVGDLDTVVAGLEARGVVVEEVDVPGLRTIGGIAEVEGNYPSKGAKGERAVWFRDSEGNLLGIGQPVQ